MQRLVVGLQPALSHALKLYWHAGTVCMMGMLCLAQVRGAAGRWMRCDGQLSLCDPCAAVHASFGSTQGRGAEPSLTRLGSCVCGQTPWCCSCR